MDEPDLLAARFEENRDHLRAVAYRMLGSLGEAEDAVQESWLRLSRSDISAVDNLGGWLTTVIGRVCLDMLRTRRSRAEEPMGAAEPVAHRAAGVDPEHEALLADSVGPALLVVLEALVPVERLAFVLHDMFAVPFDEIAPIVGRSPAAARQLASRARRRVQGTSPASGADANRQRQIVDAFLAASREGDFNALLEMLDPDAVLRSDAAAAQLGAPPGVLGAQGVAHTFAGRAHAAKLALVDGVAGAVWGPGGRPKVVFGFTVVDGAITAIDIVAEPGRLGELELEVLEG